MAKSTEKLSSGYRINRAADDAAGLAISEKMRAQVRGLNRASDNAQGWYFLLSRQLKVQKFRTRLLYEYESMQILQRASICSVLVVQGRKQLSLG